VAAARQQQATRRSEDAPAGIRIDWARVGIVAFILVAAIVANVVANVWFPVWLDRAPVIGLAVWAAILISIPLRAPDWAVMPATFKGTLFLLSLVACAAMMPVEKLPALVATAFGLGFFRGVDNPADRARTPPGRL